jgi:hypothetical protein
MSFHPGRSYSPTFNQRRSVPPQDGIREAPPISWPEPQFI